MNSERISVGSLQRCSTKKYISSIVIVSVKPDSITSLKVKVTVYFTQITTVNKNYHFDEKPNKCVHEMAVCTVSHKNKLHCPDWLLMMK